MPERKGRKRRPREHRRHRGESAEPPERREPAPSAPKGRAAHGEPSRPALWVRYAGLLLGVITMYLGVLTVAQGIGSSGFNAVVLIVVGALLAALALALGALSLVPDRVRRLFER